MDEWERDVRESLYVQRLLPLHKERSLEAEFAQKRVLRSAEITGLPRSGPRSPGSVLPEVDGFTLCAPARGVCWPAGMPQDGDYTNWGQADACIMRGDADWSGMNRLRFEVLPFQAGAGHMVLNAAVILETGDEYAREGETTFNLASGQWQSC